MKMIQKAAALLLALLMLAGICTAAEPQISSEGLAMMGVLDQQSEQSEETAAAPVQEPDWKLLLVNPGNKLPENYSVTLKRLANGMYVDERIYDDLNAMLTDCRKTGLQPVVCSAYRTHATQVRLHNNKIARLRSAGYSYEAAVKEAARWVAVPGTSEHETGMALDLVSYHYQVLDTKQENTPEQKWLMEHSWEYGFILRYPNDKTEVTGIGYEPWHYRYVGRENAAKIHESGLCLEGYLQSQATAAAAAATAAESPAAENELHQQPA